MTVDVQTDKAILTHPKGSSVEVYLYGATVTSWKSGSLTDSKPVERLFVSLKAALDGSKPIRGGIPVVFPCFGAPTHPDHSKLGQHGFARNQVWKWDSVVMDNDAGVSVRLVLEPTPDITTKYDKPFHLAYVITLAEHQLSTDLHVKNASSTEPLEFQALFHNYIRAPSNEAFVTPLINTTYYDKTEPTEEGKSTAKEEIRLGVDVKKFTDFVYENPPAKVEVGWPGSRLEIKTTGLNNLVVWNPQQEAGSKIADMEQGGWERFICVEPGYVRGFVKVDAGQSWVGQQIISVVN